MGILAGHIPIITQMARGVRDGSRYLLDMARRMYRFVWNRRLSSSPLQEGLYARGQATVARYGAQELVVAIDPVNFEKPSTQRGFRRCIKAVHRTAREKLAWHAGIRR